MGSPAYAVPTLDALIEAGHRVSAVYCQPPRPAGRGHRLEPSPVEGRARALGLAVRSPKSLKSPEETEAFGALALDAAVVVAYGLLLPPAILAAPRLGCLNAHASLLPRWRGAAPIERAIMAGDAETGVTIMQMEQGLDTGPILLTRHVPIACDTIGGALREALSRLSASLMIEALEGLATGSLVNEAQDDTQATYAPKLTSAEERLDWARPAAALERVVRAFSPRPGAYLVWQAERIKVFGAEVLEQAHTQAEPGTVLDNRLLIACEGGGALRPLSLQRPGRKALALDEFLRGCNVPKGSRLA
ncbi:MAG: methionyl-tRNA formyltransferase [Alphaproteobacteria bacterium]|nr:methionyl-tRNA formyltransferase [Alphaproteobacteria bacterium]